jgi:toxin ParE1/3/4
MSNLKLKYLSSAVQDLIDIRTYIAADDPKAAQRVSQILRNLIKSLAQFPHLGKAGRVFGTREFNTPKIGKTAHVVVYRVQQAEVQILRVLPGMRDLDNLLL